SACLEPHGQGCPEPAAQAEPARDAGEAAPVPTKPGKAWCWYQTEEVVETDAIPNFGHQRLSSVTIHSYAIEFSPERFEPNAALAAARDSGELPKNSQVECTTDPRVYVEQVDAWTESRLVRDPHVITLP